MSFSYDEMSSFFSVKFCFGKKHVDGQNILKNTISRAKIAKYIEGN